MRTAVAGGLLAASNAVWFGILWTIRRHGYRVSVVNSLQDLKSFRSLILRSDPNGVRLRFSLALAALYFLLCSCALLIAF